MARPRQENRKDFRLMARFTDAEAKTVNTAASAAGVTVSDFLRAAALNAPLPKRSRRIAVSDSGQLGTLLGAIGRIGNNLNQLSRVANTGSWPEGQRLHEACNDIQWMRYHVMQALGVHDDRPDMSDQPGVDSQP